MATLAFHFWERKTQLCCWCYYNVKWPVLSMRESFIFISINTSGFAHIHFRLQFKIKTAPAVHNNLFFVPVPQSCSVAKPRQNNAQQKTASSWQFPFYSTCCQGHPEVKLNSPFGLFCLFLPISPPSTYVHTDMVYSLYLNSIITLDFYQTWGQRKQRRRLDVSMGVARSCCLIREGRMGIHLVYFWL